MRAAWMLQGIGYLILGIAIYFVIKETSMSKNEIINDNKTPMNDKSIIVRSPAFAHEEFIPSKYTCDGENISPPIAIDNIPKETISIVLIMEDPDVPKNIREDGMWNHWVVFNIPPSSGRIGEGEEPNGVHGITTSNTLKYEGPCPPDGEHRYFFKVYALDSILRLNEGATKDEVLETMKGHILSTGELIGKYARIIK